MLIDCFMFSNEYDILEGRMEYLDSAVDKFVIVESNINHNGTTKKLNFLENINRYSKFMHKIFYYPVFIDKNAYDFVNKSDDPGNRDTGFWKVENFQRNHISKALEFFNDEDIVMISDVDEIPHKYAIELAKFHLAPDNPLIGFKQDMFFYNFNQKQSKPCWGTVLSTNKTARQKTPQWIREHRWYQQIPHVEYGGYHLSFWGSPKSISDKIVIAPHQEYHSSKTRDIDYIRERIRLSEDIYERPDNPLERVDRSTIDKEFREIFEKFECVNRDHIYDGIDDNMTNEDILFYKQMIDLYDNGHFVEVGSKKGKGASYLATEISNTGKEIKLDCIVDDVNIYEFSDNMVNLTDHYTAYVEKQGINISDKYKYQSLDFVFINCSDMVQEKVESWLPRVKFGGIIGGHINGNPEIIDIVSSKFGPLNLFGKNCWWTYKTNSKTNQ
jgi:beta-1,4-mannosyl-glycoprotein beta-1,4-N-acetylglucosaminyltransferase